MPDRQKSLQKKKRMYIYNIYYTTRVQVEPHEARPTKSAPLFQSNAKGDGALEDEHQIEMPPMRNTT